MPPTSAIKDSSFSNNNNDSFIDNTLNDDDNTQRETVIVFDWDDTLLSSTFLASAGYRLDSNMALASEPLLDALSQLSSSVCSLLKLASSFGRVCIITNAETGWVELSCAKFLPQVLPLLSQLNITILSARSTFECQYPDSPLKWKSCAFESLLGELLSTFHISKNILSFGDSHVEREAVRSVTMHIQNTFCKSVKFAERPTCEQLKRQIDLVVNCFEYLHTHNNHLDLQLTVSLNNEQPEKEREIPEAMKCREVSSQPAHDDGNGSINKNNNCVGSSATTNNVIRRSKSSSEMKMDEDDDDNDRDLVHRVHATQESTNDNDSDFQAQEAY
jgi:hypothetical protein